MGAIPEFRVLPQTPIPIAETLPQRRLLRAAEEVFAETGYEGATVREITRRAMMNIASVNYHFRNKEELYIATVRFAHQCAARMESFPVFPEDTPPVEKLRGFIREMVSRMHAPTRPSALKLMMREMSDPGRAAHVVVAEFVQPVAFALRAILRELLPGLDERRLLATGFSVIGQILFYRQNRPVAELIFGKEAVEALDVELVTEHVTRFTLAALGHAEPVGGRPNPPPPSLRGKGGKAGARSSPPLPAGEGAGGRGPKRSRR